MDGAKFPPRRVVLRLGNGALLGYFGGTAFMAGQALAGAAHQPPETPTDKQPLLALGIAGATVGAALALAGVVLLVLAGKDALSIRAAAREAGVDPAPAS